MSLPRDVARCGGSWQTIAGQRKPIPQCVDCLRRTEPPEPYQTWIAPPEHPAECGLKVTPAVVVPAGFFDQFMRGRA
jgi:hypothetical protein